MWAPHATLSVAESCTGGMLSKLLTDVPGSSDYFRGGVVSYSNAVKQSLLGISRDDLTRHGAVSAETAAAMARGARALAAWAAHLGAAMSMHGHRLAARGGGTPKKPVGLVYIGLDRP